LSLSADTETVMQALYSHLHSAWKLTYRHELSGLDFRSQRIRLPHQVLLDFVRRLGQGTCLDLALLLAGCLESRGKQPLIAVLDTGTGAHAILGCWRRARPGLDPLITDRQRIEDAIWLDPNGLTRESRYRLDFADSIRAASRQLTSGKLVFALDVTAARNDQILPLPFAGEPQWSEVAARAIVAAQKLSEAIPTQLATVPLLLGMLSMEGGVTRTAFNHCFEDVKPILDNLVAALPKRRSLRAASRNYFHILDLARSKAKFDGSPLVLERHLLSALLGLASTSLDAALKSIGTSKLELLSALQILVGGSSEKSTYSTFSEFTVSTV
jgi:hypothetical protein